MCNSCQRHIDRDKSLRSRMEDEVSVGSFFKTEICLFMGKVRKDYPGLIESECFDLVERELAYLKGLAL